MVANSPLYLLHITFKIDNQNLLSDQIKNFFQINLSILITRFLDNVWIIIIGRSYMFITSGSWKVDSFKRITISIKLIAKTVLWSYFVIGTGHHTSLIVNLQHWTLTIFWACVFISRNFSIHSFLTSKIFDNLVYKKKYLSQINIHKHWHLWKLTYIIVSVKVWLAYIFHWIMKNIPQGWETWLENHQECHLKKNDIKILCSTSVNFHEKCVSTSLS